MSPVRLEVTFLAGPPAGPALFDEAVRRLPQARAPALLDPGRPGGWAAIGERLAETLSGRSVLVAHGLAVPAAIHAAQLRRPAALVLANGPLWRLDRVTAALASAARAWPRTFPAVVLRPGPWLAWLASSAGLRRTVSNPYAMDHDRVAAIAGGLVSTSGYRRALSAYLASLAGGLPDPTRSGPPTWLLWGDDDTLYPASDADRLDAALGGGRHVRVPGGRYFYPEERPWLLADFAAGLARSDAAAGAPQGGATAVSGQAGSAAGAPGHVQG